jgi:predicted nucleotidyltransferase
VRSDDSIESDVDFLLEYQDGVSLFDVAELKRELEEKLDRKVDLVSLKYLNKRIREKVIQEKIRIL